MGDVGEYWREHKDHVRRKKLGITRADEKRWAKEERDEKKQEHFERCTIKCECGKWFLDKGAHNCHKQHKGKNGHGIAETKEPKEPETEDGIIF